MSKNWKFGNIGNDVTLALAVTAGAAGDVVPVGAGGLFGYLVTDRAAPGEPAAAGLDEGYASVRLLPAQGVIELEVAADPGAAVYGQVSGANVTYSTTGGAGKYLVGHAVAPQGQAVQSGRSFVYLGTGGTPAPSGG